MVYLYIYLVVYDYTWYSAINCILFKNVPLDIHILHFKFDYGDSITFNLKGIYQL